MIPGFERPVHVYRKALPKFMKSKEVREEEKRKRERAEEAVKEEVKEEQKKE